MVKRTGKCWFIEYKGKGEKRWRKPLVCSPSKQALLPTKQQIASDFKNIFKKPVKFRFRKKRFQIFFPKLGRPTVLRG